MTDKSLTGKAAQLSIPVEKMVVAKKDKEGNVSERRIVLHFYIKGNQFTTNTISWVRVEAIPQDEDSFDDALNAEKDFLSEAMPLMFQSADKEEWNPIVLELTGWGPAGYFIVILLLSLPLAIIIFPRTRWGRRPTEKDEPAR
ncbi:MAG: hypothetical protein FJZ95_09935 [Chloroflexi bacterium]|nr:hypothetical protein [Chloroflexota bacterium]